MRENRVIERWWWGRGAWVVKQLFGTTEIVADQNFPAEKQAARPHPQPEFAEAQAQGSGPR